MVEAVEEWLSSAPYASAFVVTSLKVSFPPRRLLSRALYTHLTFSFAHPKIECLPIDTRTLSTAGNSGGRDDAVP